MKYLLIKYTIGGVLFVSQVTPEFIVNYEVVKDKKQLINIIDRKQNLEINASSSIKNHCGNSYSEGWSASGISKKIISKNSNYYNTQFGNCLKIDYKSHREGIIDDDKFETNKVEIYISKDHNLVAKYCLIESEIDWRILNNNPNEDHLEFPYLVHSYVEHDNDKTSIFKVIEFKELEFTIEEYDFIKDVLGQNIQQNKF